MRAKTTSQTIPASIAGMKAKNLPKKPVDENKKEEDA